MKNLAFLIAFLLGNNLLIAQFQNLSRLANVQKNGNWIEMLPESKVPADIFFETFQHDLGLNAQYTFELIHTSEDGLGFSHYRYRQKFKGYPIEGATFIIHAKDGFVTHANGKIIRGLVYTGQLKISSETALETAKNYMQAETFKWNLPHMESLIKHIKNDPDASFLPQAELVFTHPQYSGEGKHYKLSWKFDIHAASPEKHNTLYVDSDTGEIILDMEGIHENAVEGIAETRYHGTQTIITDSISPNQYRLRDMTRGGGIETYDLNENTDITLAEDFLDEDNYWNNVNDELDDAATDAHWGAEMFYDYMLETYGRDSYDGNGSPMVNYIHYDKDWNNAQWTGLYAQYGDGNGNPRTSVNTVAHEFTHGIVRSSAGLVYLNESGALNESFCDIIGTLVEHFALEEEANWLYGTPGLEVRDFTNPNTFGHPDTYLGNHWYTGTLDFGGVHTNSGVQNFWFYLLSEGGSGINDNGETYEVEAVGMEKAGAIAYRNLTEYLTESSDYYDARIGSLQSAKDIFGSCSFEVEQVAKAWHAVGVGNPTNNPDFQIIDILSPLTASCDLATEEISMSFRYNSSGCDIPVPEGSEIALSYRINDNEAITETIILAEALQQGEEISYKFNTPANLSESNIYRIDYSIKYQGDLYPLNDAINNHVLTKPTLFTDNKLISFNTFSSDSLFYVVTGNNSSVTREFSAANTGLRGLLMNSFGATPQNVTIIPSEDENFTANPEFVSKMCMCVDLSDWYDAFLNFDLRQTYSPFYLENFGLNVNYMIALRVTIDGDQIGDQFHPVTNNSDLYLTHEMDISSYAGSSFTLCFEAVNFLNDDEIPGMNGDKSTLDNVYLSQSNTTHVEELRLSDLKVYPNPSQGLVSIEIKDPGTYKMELINLLGHVVKSQTLILNGNPTNLDMSELNQGVYMLTMRSDKYHAVKRLILN